MTNLSFKRLQEMMIQKKKTLALAESCTGGFISYLITKEPGSSEYFLGSLVTYSNALKSSIFSVSQKILIESGPVSRECARAMVEGLMIVSQADVGVAITGVAGPGGGSQKTPVGTVFLAIMEKGKEVNIELLELEGSRTEIIEAVALHVLNILCEKVQNGAFFSLS